MKGKGELALTLREHYKFHSRKSIKPYAALCFLVILLITNFYTLGRYLSAFSVNSTIVIANWSISINGNNITTNTNELTMSLYNVADDLTNLKAGDTCYFDITIDPSSTEVSLSYSIAIDLTAGNNPLPSGSIIDRYEIYTGTSLTLDDTITNLNASNYTISDSFILTNNQPLNENSIRKYRIYCNIPANANITDAEVLKVNPLITLQQNI